jgi:hypothetical protein
MIDCRLHGNNLEIDTSKTSAGGVPLCFYYIPVWLGRWTDATSENGDGGGNGKHDKRDGANLLDFVAFPDIHNH